MAENVPLRVFDIVGAAAAAASGIGEDQLDIELDAGGADGPLGAVRRLCSITRSSEVDDIERRSCTTPGSVAVPVALLMSVDRPVSGSAFSAAVAAGYEAMVAVGEAIEGPQVLYRGVWPSYVGAPLAAAATAARLLELDERQTVDALAIAAARIAGSVGRPAGGQSSRWFLYGCAAADGVAAAHAAERGIRGDPHLLEAVLRSQAHADPLEIAFEPGELPALNRVDVKPFCTARQAQAAVEAATLAAAKLPGLGVEEIEAIDVGVPAAYAQMIDQPQINDRVTSIMSAQFQISVALADPEVLFDVGRKALPPGAKVERLMRTVAVTADPELTPLFPALWPARVRIRARDGREASEQVLEPDGTGKRTPSWRWLERKHAALGSFGGQLCAAAQLCRELKAGAPVAAGDLLNLILQKGATRLEPASRAPRLKEAS